MENTPSPSVLPSLANAIYLLATFLASALSGVLGLFVGRRQRSADIHKTNAETAKTEAETRQIDSSILLKAYERLDDLEEIARNQAVEITTLQQDRLTQEFSVKDRERDIVRLKGELDILNRQVARARANGFLVHESQPGTPNPAAGTAS